jgi:hypothetical protein
MEEVKEDDGVRREEGEGSGVPAASPYDNKVPGPEPVPAGK